MMITAMMVMMALINSGTLPELLVNAVLDIIIGKAALFHSLLCTVMAMAMAWHAFIIFFYCVDPVES
jgi:hypothetical protein